MNSRQMGNSEVTPATESTQKQVASRKKLAPKSKGSGTQLPTAPQPSSSMPAPPPPVPFSLNSETFNFNVGSGPNELPPSFVGAPEGPTSVFDDPSLFDPRVKLQGQPSQEIKTLFDDPAFFDPRVKDVPVQTEVEEKTKKQRKKSRNQERKEARQRRMVVVTDDHKLYIQECLDQLIEEDLSEDLSKALEIVKSEMETTPGLDPSDAYGMVGLDVLPKGKLDALLDCLSYGLGVRVPTDLPVVPVEQTEEARREEEDELEEVGEGAVDEIPQNGRSNGLGEALNDEFHRVEAEAPGTGTELAIPIDPSLTSLACQAENSSEAASSARLPASTASEEKCESEEVGEGAAKETPQKGCSDGPGPVPNAEFHRLEVEEAEGSGMELATAASIDPSLTSFAWTAESSACLPASALFSASDLPMPNPHPMTTTAEMVPEPSRMPTLSLGWPGSEGSSEDPERQYLRDEVNRLTIALQEAQVEINSTRAASEQAVEHARASAQSELGEAKAMLDNQFRQEVQQATSSLAAEFLAHKTVLEEESRKARDTDLASAKEHYEADLAACQAVVINLQKSASVALAEKQAFTNELAELKSKLSQGEKDKKARFAEYEAELNRRAKREQDLLDRLRATELQLQTVVAEKEELARTGTKTRANLDLETVKRREAEAALGREKDRIADLEARLDASREELLDSQAALWQRDTELDALATANRRVEEELKGALADKKALVNREQTTKARLMAELAAKDNEVKRLHAQIAQMQAGETAKDPVSERPTMEEGSRSTTSRVTKPSFPRRLTPSTLGPIEIATVETPREETSTSQAGKKYDGTRIRWQEDLGQFDAELERFKAKPRSPAAELHWTHKIWYGKREASKSGSPVLETKSDSTTDEDAWPSIKTPQSPPSKITAKAVEELDAGQEKEARKPDVCSAASAAGGRNFSEGLAASAVEPNAGRVRLAPHQDTVKRASDSAILPPSAGGQEVEAAEEQANQRGGSSTTRAPYVSPVQASGTLPSASDVEVGGSPIIEERWVDAFPNLPGSWPETIVSPEAPVTTSIAGLAGVGPGPARLMDAAVGMLERYPFAIVLLVMFLLATYIGLRDWWEVLEERNRWVAANTPPPSYGSLFPPNPAPSIFWQWTWGYKPRWAMILHYRIVEYLDGDRWWPIPDPEWLP